MLPTGYLGAQDTCISNIQCNVKVNIVSALDTLNGGVHILWLRLLIGNNSIAICEFNAEENDKDEDEDEDEAGLLDHYD